MALETLTAQTASRTGAIITITNVTTVGGFQFNNNGRTLIVVSNDGGAATVVTFAIVTTVDSEAVSTKDVTVADGEEWVIGPFPTDWYNNSAGNVVCTIDADLATTYGIGVIKF